MSTTRGALMEYAEYCAVDTWQKDPAGWLTKHGVCVYDQHQISLSYPDGQVRYRETTGRRAHRWKQGSKTSRSVYWPACLRPEDGRSEGGVWDRVLLVKGESSVLALAAFYDDASFGGGVFVAGSPGSTFPLEGEWTKRVADAARKATDGVYAWTDTEPEDPADAGGQGWAESVRAWAHLHGLTEPDRVSGIDRPVVWEVGPFGMDGRDWVRSRPAVLDAVDIDRLWKNVRELPASGSSA